MDKSTQANADNWESQPEVAFNPLTGFQFSDFFKASQGALKQLTKEPIKASRHFLGFQKKLINIFSDSSDRLLETKDPRFKDEAWRNNPFYRFLLKAYLITDESLKEWVGDADFNPTDKVRAEYLVRLILESAAPTNSLIGNPQALKKAIDTRGMSLVQGAYNLSNDIKNNHGIPSQVRKDGFMPGKNIATSKGRVVFKNDLMELIQYKPKTEMVYERPLLLVPPQINKFYVLDLAPEKSIVQFCLDKGYQVFMVSWRNPRPEHGDWGISEYAQSVIEAVEVMKSVTRFDSINMMAFCSGAMSALPGAAYLKQINDDSIHSLTIGVCILEAEKADSEMGAFTNSKLIDTVKERSKRKKILRGHELAISMIWLRPHDLIWANVVNNYLLGNEPPEFDLLFWNNDWTALPGQLHADYLDIFWYDTAASPDKIKVNGVPIQLNNLNQDAYIIAGTTDHITPWKACYRTSHLLSGDVKFCLSRSGHVQSLLNSPAKKNASYYLNDHLPKSSEEWLKSAKLLPGSWWIDWHEWLQQRSGNQKQAPKRLGNRKHKPGIDAPGEYVLEQAY